MVQQNGGEFLSAAEAFNFLGVTRRTLDRYVELGLIKKHRKGLRRVFYKRTDLEQLKAELETIRPAEEEL